MRDFGGGSGGGNRSDRDGRRGGGSGYDRDGRRGGGGYNYRDSSGGRGRNDRGDGRGGGGGCGGGGDGRGGGNGSSRDFHSSPPQVTNSRWDMTAGDSQHGTITKTASKESLRQTWSQIRAARQAKMSNVEQQPNTNSSQQPGAQQQQYRESGLSVFATRTQQPTAVRRQHSNHSNNGPRRQMEKQVEKQPTVEDDAQKPAIYEPPETKQLRQYFSERSSIFRDWEKTRGDGWTNKNVANFFDKKKTSHDNERVKGKKGHGTDMRRIGPLFNRFYDYAHDINAGTNYVERALQICQVTGSCDFLDFGFAPGGMSHLLLSKHPGMRGSGVTLDPLQGGNVWPNWLDQDPRFFSCVGDVVDMARDEVDLKKKLKLPDDFTGFDFVIVGITIHQGHLLGRDEGEGGIMGHANELKDRLHFAQLYFAFKHLKPGGMVLMRHHMSVRLVDYHFLALMLSLFNPEELAITNVMKKQKAAENVLSSQEQRSEREHKPKQELESEKRTTTSNSQDARSRPVSKIIDLNPTILATKPMAGEFFVSVSVFDFFYCCCFFYQLTNVILLIFSFPTIY